MILPAIMFYLFAAVAIASGVMVVTARNPVHSVLFLILAFFNAAGLFVLMGAEFLAMILVIVYVGAVAVLFLFVVMMLDIDFAELKRGALQYLPIGGMIGLAMATELVLIVGAFVINPDIIKAPVAAIPSPDKVSNVAAIGRVLYTQYLFYFQAAGMILLVSMIGAIVLTHRERVGVKRQRIATQLERGRDSVEIKNVPTGSGV